MSSQGQSDTHELSLQADTCALETNFKKYIETNATYALKMPARNYETLYK